MTIDDGGLLEFQFRDILLPDSLTNEPASHGFIKYSIKPKTGLTENTLIYNEAGIYFDFNPPIITNTTESKMVSQLSKQSTSNITGTIKVYPNPFDNFAYLEVKGVVGNLNLKADLFDLTGSFIETYEFNAKERLKIYRKQLPPGMYFLRIYDSNNKSKIASGKFVVD